MLSRNVGDVSEEIHGRISGGNPEESSIRTSAGISGRISAWVTESNNATNSGGFLQDFF